MYRIIGSTGAGTSTCLSFVADSALELSSIPALTCGYYNAADQQFYEEPAFTNAIVGSSGKYYVDMASQGCYSWTNESGTGIFFFAETQMLQQQMASFGSKAFVVGTGTNNEVHVLDSGGSWVKQS